MVKSARITAPTRAGRMERAEFVGVHLTGEPHQTKIMITL